MASGCTAMNADGVPDDAPRRIRENICLRCVEAAQTTANLKAWETRWLKLDMKPQLRRPASRVRDTFIENAASYEVLLQYKCEKIPRQNRLLKIINNRVTGLLALQPVAEKIIDEKEYHAVICYNSLYGIHQLFWRIARKKRIPFFSLHHSHNAAKDDEFTLVRDNIYRFLKHLQKIFPTAPPVSECQLTAIRAHDRAMRASRKIWSYSSSLQAPRYSASLKKYQGKVLVCLSSPDEILAAQRIGLVPTKSRHHAFSDQIEWLQWIFSLASKNPKIFFWIRPHPRLYPNKREKQVSDLAKRLARLRGKKRAPNVFWPNLSRQGSVWHHQNDTDLLFNAWSSLADDFGKEEIPVLTFFPEFSNSGRVVDGCARDRRGYEALFQEALRNPTTICKPKQHEKWKALFLNANSFPIDLRRNPLLLLAGKTLLRKKKQERNLQALISPFGLFRQRSRNRKLESLFDKLTTRRASTT